MYSFSIKMTCFVKSRSDSSAIFSILLISSVCILSVLVCVSLFCIIFHRLTVHYIKLKFFIKYSCIILYSLVFYILNTEEYKIFLRIRSPFAFGKVGSWDRTAKQVPPRKRAVLWRWQFGIDEHDF